MNQVSIIGYGGHAKVTANILILNNYEIIGYYDDNVKNKYIIGTIDDLKFCKTNIICAIGNNKIRNNITSKYKNLKWINAIHPNAVITQNAQLGKGIVICPGVIIQPNVVINDHCIINTSANIDHDTIIGSHVHVAPGTTICGTVNIDKNTFVGSGSTIINNINIGKNVIIGAGSVVIRNIQDNCKAYGVPCKIIGEL